MIRKNCVGANSFAHNQMGVRMNSHLEKWQDPCPRSRMMMQEPSSAGVEGYAECNSSRMTSRSASFRSSVTSARRRVSLMSVWYPRPLARALYACNTASSNMMVMRVLPVESAGSTSRNGRNSANCSTVSSGLSSSGASANGAASTAAQSISGSGSDLLIFKFLLFTGIRLSERNDMNALIGWLAKHHHHQASGQGGITDKPPLWINPPRVFAHQ